MSKIVKQAIAATFLAFWTLTGYRVKKIGQFSPEENIGTIAIFSTTALGDFLLNTPAINAIKTRWPNARLILVIHPRNKDLAVGSPLFSKILYWNGKANGVIALARQLRDLHVEATFILHSRAPYDIITASLARSPVILKDVYFNDYQGQDTFKMARFLSSHYDNRRNGNIHYIHQKTQLLESTGIEIPSYEMFIPVDIIREKRERQTVGIHAGASTPERCWPTEKFTLLIQNILQRHPEVDIELIGGPGEKTLNQNIIDNLPDKNTRVTNLAGTTDLKQLVAKIAGFSCLVVGDTGPLHISIALKTPAIILFGGQMYADGARPLQDSEIHHMIVAKDEEQGLHSISVESVYQAIEQCLQQEPAHRA